MAKAIVLFSGGLDSRLAIKLMQDQNIEVLALFFKLPFGGGCCNNFECVLNYSQVQGVNLKVIDCTKSPYLVQYLEIIKRPRHGTGTSMNPCKDCKIFMFKIAKEIMEKENYDFIVTGEVLGQRPMSQLKRYLSLTERKAKLEGKILRPLSAKLLLETIPEKQGLVDRNKFLAIEGRQRQKQIQLAKQYNIKYPLPTGGCLLCEKLYAPKLKDLFKNKSITYEDIQLLSIGRHFRDNGRIVIGKNEIQNNKLIEINKTLKHSIIIPTTIPGPVVIYEDKKDKQLAEQIQLAFSKKDEEARKQFDKYKIV
jgi:tRNA U34 2-thiouridine synthase MnmA/TrmU